MHLHPSQKWNRKDIEITWKHFDRFDLFSYEIESITCDNVFMSIPYLKSLEEAIPSNTNLRYVVFYSGQNAVGWALFQMIHINLRSSLKLKEDSSFLSKMTFKVKSLVASCIDYTVVVAGNMLMTGENFSYFVDGISVKNAYRTLGKCIEQSICHWQKTWPNAKLVLIKDFYPNKSRFSKFWSSLGYAGFRIEPNMVFSLPPQWKVYEDYFAAISSKYRIRLKRAAKKFGTFTVKKMSSEEIFLEKERMNHLYLNVVDGAGFNAVYISKDYFYQLSINLQENFHCIGIYDGDELIGFYTYIINHSDFDTHFLGFKTESNRENQIYLNMLNFMVNNAIDHGCKRIVFSRTATEIKSSIGAVDVEMDLYLKHTGKLMQFFIVPFLLKLLVPKEEYLIRKPFKDE